jgi:hypothetical protein
LKDFQRATAKYAFDRLYSSDGTRRFLVADEVGLGKTLVARGVIAHAIDHLWGRVPRIDIVYICSNADIARQNVQRLRIPGCTASALASRLTLLPLQVRNLARQPVNFVAFTPGTSFEQTSGGGIVEERALLYWLLDRAWGIHGRVAPIYVLRDWASVHRFEYAINEFDRSRIDESLAVGFVRALQGAKHAALKVEFDELCRRFCRRDVEGSAEDRSARSRWISKMRRVLASVCLHALKPDLIILDEFQRFKHLLSDNTPPGELARDLFDYASEKTAARVLLLSATPYKMLSLHHETEDDHYGDFVATLEFLTRGNTSGFEALLDAYREAIANLHLSQGIERLRQVKSQVEAHLRLVIARTERLAIKSDRGGMLEERCTTVPLLKARDVSGYLGLQKVADALGQGELVEYWKSAPYLFNFMEEYQLKTVFKSQSEGSAMSRELLRLVRNHSDAFLPVDRIRRYQAVEPGNVRLRALAADTVESGAWRMLWVPPALSYYELAGPFADPQLRTFTKRLVFSAWHVVPKTVACLLSYDVERRMIRGKNPNAVNTPEARKRRRGLLRFAFSEGRLTGMPLFTLVYPSLSLAVECDPREVARNARPDGDLVSAADVIRTLRERIQREVDGLNLRRRNEGPSDETWYWAAPMLLDYAKFPEHSAEWWAQPNLVTSWAGSAVDADDVRWADHVREASRLIAAVRDGAHALGPPPDDLAEVLAYMASAGPAVATLRALCRRQPGGVVPSDIGARNAAGRVGRAFLSLFNHPEVREMIRAWRGDEPYWLRVLEYVHAGGLQAMLDEYMHVLSDLSLAQDASGEEAVQTLSDELISALTLRTAALRTDEITAPPFTRAVKVESQPLRIRFAMRFGDERSEDEATAGMQMNGTPSTRKERVRAAFNSPFWPFVLVTTSVGQEGLDFHPYCHCVVHWNLPSNPVDLEQREGRVHRYKGHAVRKNIATSLHREVLEGTDSDVWSAAFALARSRRAPADSDLVPYWLYAGDAKIERNVPLLPFSRDVDRLDDLRRSLMVYRMVFGQCRQEDLIRYLLTALSDEQRAATAAELRIDLSPPEDDALMDGDQSL